MPADLDPPLADRELDGGAGAPGAGSTAAGLGRASSAATGARAAEGRLPLSEADCYRAVRSRDARFDGWFFIAVTTTGIYCRPACPTPVHPKPEHSRFFATAAGAQAAGFRACKRCRPDTSPGSPGWDLRGDLVGRAMRLIADGVVDREGVSGLARRLAVSTRHLDRVLSSELGAGPLAVARAQRAHTARVLVETTDLRFADVAFAAGFSSIRQFNDTMRAVYDRSPSEMRTRAPHRNTSAPGVITVRLAYRSPLDVDGLLGWFRARPIAGSRWVDGSTLHVGLGLAGGVAHAALTPVPDESHVRAELALAELADLTAAVERCRRLLDLDADPTTVADDLGRDPRLRAALSSRPGMRVPGSVDGLETAVVAIVGQQVSVAAAHAIMSRIVAQHGATSSREPTLFAFPPAGVLADADLEGCGTTRRGADAIRAVAALVASGFDLAPGADAAEVRARLLAIGGIGGWTVDYVALRALRDPDVLPVGDLGVRRGAALLGLPDDAAELARVGASWSPWRSYAAHLCWSATTGAAPRLPRSPAARTRPQVVPPDQESTVTVLPEPADPLAPLRTRTVESPVGVLTLVASPTGLRAVLWPDDEAGGRVRFGVEPGPHDGTDDAHPVLDAAEAQLAEWFAGERTTFALQLEAAGTEFQRAVWTSLTTIPFGETSTYGEQAASLGRPTAVRAVASANGRNPLSIVVPCHRIIGRDGSLTGFAGGLDAKSWLLDHERHVLSRTRTS